MPAIAQQAPEIAFERYSVEHGLSSYPITALLQDQQGFLWIGTLDGLNRFDGYTFEVFNRTPSGSAGLSNSSINYGTLYEHAGALWIGTRGGLNRYDLATGRFRTFRHAAEDSTSLSHDNVTALAATDRHTLWVGTSRGLNRLDLRHDRFTRYDHNPTDPNALGAALITALFVDGDSTLWVGTRAGLARYDPLQNRFTRPLDTLGWSSDAAAIYVTAIEPGRDGSLWIATNGDGLIRFSPGSGDVERYRHDPNDPGSLPTDRVLSLLHNSEGLWVGTWGRGLCHFREATTSFTCHRNRLGDEQSLSDDLVSTLLSDRAGNLFVGTWNGLNKRAAGKPFRTYSYDPQRPDSSLSHPRVNAVYHDVDGVLWIGTLGGGLNRMDRSAGTVEHFRHDPRDPTSLGHDDVRSIIEYAGDLWIGTVGGGVSRLNRRTGRFTHYRHDPDDPSSLGSDLIYTTHHDETGTLWVTTVTDGLFRYEPSRDGFMAYRSHPDDTTSLAHNSVWPLLSRGDTLWIGTVGGGLDALNRRTGQFTHHRHDPDDPSSLSSNQVLSLALDQDGSLWVGTLGGGLNRFDNETGRFAQYTTADGLTHHNAVCILPTPHALWIGTTNGLSRLDLQDDTFTQFGTHDGLPSPIFYGGACYKSRRGELFFGTDEGLVSFFPDQIQRSDYEPPVLITEIQLFNRPLSLDSAFTSVRTIALPYDSNFVAFRFAALDYTVPSQNQYAFMLEGLDPDWVHVGNRRYASYPNLPPGTYTFRIKGTNSDGVWNERGAALRLVIRPPFWRTWWFMALVAVLLAGFVLAAHRYRVYHLLQAERLRRRIAQDLHDEIGSEIGSLAFSIELSGRSQDLDTEKRKELLSLSQRARRATDSIRETTWVVDARNDTLTDLVDRMHEVTYQLFPDGRARFEPPAAVPPVRLDMEMRQHVYLIFKEVLHNAARHSRAGRVLVRVQYDDRMLTLRISDDGAGFDPSRVQRGDGLDNLHARAERIGAELTIESRPGQGTTIRLRVKIA